MSAAGLLAEIVWKTWLRIKFPYDLMYWPDDYYLSVLLRLDLGLPAYGDPSDANSWIYSPGGPLLGWLILKPLGLVRSYLAHKLLSLIWLVLTLGIMSWLGSSILRQARLAQAHQAASRGPLPLARLQELTGVGLLACILGLAAFMNPIADSLHPTNLELLALSLTALAGFHFHSRTFLQKLFICVSLPALGLLAKQTSLMPICVSLAIYSYFSKDLSLRRRLYLCAGAGLSAALCFGLLWLSWGHNFLAWVWHIPRAAGWEWRKYTDLTSGVGLIVYPPLALVLMQLLALKWSRLGRRLNIISPGKYSSEPERASQKVAPFLAAPYVRAALPALLYTPIALIAFFKALGGPNNLMVLLFLFSALATPLLIALALYGQITQRLMAFALLGAGLCFVWSPEKRVPTEAEYRYGATVCDYVAAREQCGEKVYLGRGMACYLQGNKMPLDRTMAAEDISQSSYALGYAERLKRAEYDVFIGPRRDLLSRWLTPAQWPAVGENYIVFGIIEGGPGGDIWSEGFDRFMERTGFYERRSEQGKHSLEEPQRCEPPTNRSIPGAPPG